MSTSPPRYNPLGLHTMSTGSMPSPRSSRTKTSSVLKNERALITSTWGIGWQTPTIMIACYALALLIAFVHLFLFRYLDGKNADGINQIAPQSYVTTASNILANIFGFSLRASLGLAFVQHLWQLLRVSNMKVSTIEELFCVRSNPIFLFKPSALGAAPLLCALALVIWVSQFVTSFPPGAITVASSQVVSHQVVTVPSFNASFMGNGSGVEADAFSLMTLSPKNSNGFTTGIFNEKKDGFLLNRLARQVLLAGESFPLPTPCGSNCSYVMKFQGPYMQCNTSTSSNLTEDVFNGFPIYSGSWVLRPKQTQNTSRLYNGTYSQARFTGKTLTPLQVNGEYLGGKGNVSAVIQEDTTICMPGRAEYTVTNTYRNNVHAMEVTTNPIDTLINLVVPTHDNIVIVPGFCALSGPGYGTIPANWTESTLAFYRDNNMMAIFSSLMIWMEGSFSASLSYNSSIDASGAAVARGPYDVRWKETLTQATNGIAISLGAQNGTVVDSTRFNSAFGHFSTFQTTNPSFSITQDLLNQYLFNMTTSLMIAYGNWNTTANATRYATVNVYSFSQPLSLVLPYFITLLVSLPFVLLGCLSLFKNGVSAMDGSFMQIVATSTGSAKLDQAAAGGCLGGDESMPQELKDLRIRFGEFIDEDKPGRVKRTGFGVEGEVRTIMKGDTYGIAKWV